MSGLYQGVPSTYVMSTPSIAEATSTSDGNPSSRGREREHQNIWRPSNLVPIPILPMVLRAMHGLSMTFLALLLYTEDHEGVGKHLCHSVRCVGVREVGRVEIKTP